MAGIKRQDKDFWRWVKGFDFVSLCETWMEKKGWERIKNRLPDSHEWGYCEARREKKRGRAKEGFLIGKRKDWGDINREVGTVVEEDILVSKIRGKKKEKI